MRDGARVRHGQTTGPGPPKTGEGLTGCDGGQQGRAGHGRVPGGFQDRNLKTFRTRFSGCGISILGPGLHTGGFTVAFGHGHPRARALRLCVRLWPLDAEKSDGKKIRRPQDGELSRSWNPGPESQIRRAWNPGPEIQVLKPRVEGLKPRSWEPGPATSHWGPETQVLKSRVEVLKPRSWESNIEVLKPRSWERACVINWLKQLTGTH